MGFTGSDDDYSSLYDLPCESVADCAAACADVGGNEAMCGASECLENFDGGMDCLPATAWRNVTGASQESGDKYYAAVQSMVNQEYEDFLAVEGFGFDLPPDAQIVGIQVEFLRAAGTGDNITDFEIRLVSGGERVGEARSMAPEVWGPDLEWVSYGGQDDLWGQSWSPDAVNAQNFGAAISAKYLDTAGNGRAYVDHARITVYTSTGCETATP
jgi:hypothetical protein